jgi:hypothetical protein
VTAGIFFLIFATHWTLYIGTKRPRGDVDAQLGDRTNNQKVTEKVTDDVWTRD